MASSVAIRVPGGNRRFSVNRSVRCRNSGNAATPNATRDYSGVWESCGIVDRDKEGGSPEPGTGGGGSLNPVLPPSVCYPRGFAPRTPLLALSRAASPARSVRVIALALLARCATSRLDLASARGPRPIALSYSLRHTPLRRRAPFARLAHCVRSPRIELHPSIPLLALSLALRAALRSRGSLTAFTRRATGFLLLSEGLALGLPYSLSRAPLRRRAPFA
jgi:hypothetical protein